AKTSLRGGDLRRSRYPALPVVFAKTSLRGGADSSSSVCGRRAPTIRNDNRYGGIFIRVLSTSCPRLFALIRGQPPSPHRTIAYLHPRAHVRLRRRGEQREIPVFVFGRAAEIGR